MRSQTPRFPAEIFDRDGAVAAIAFVAGWLTLYLPVYAEFAAGAWRRDENAHALFIMAIVVGLTAARLKTSKPVQTESPIAIASGIGLIVLAISMIAIGRRSEAEIMLSASQPVAALGATLFLFGGPGVRLLWFPITISLYLIIWPGWALDAFTGPLKILVSQITADALYLFGLPVAHSGAVISAGPYQLLIVDACSGLNSLIALTSVGAVYIYAAQREDWRSNAVVLLALAPIAILANIVRVAILVLITLFFGYDAGQGFLHEGAGLVTFGASLAMVFVVDGLMNMALRGKKPR